MFILHFHLQPQYTYELFHMYIMTLNAYLGIRRVSESDLREGCRIQLVSLIIHFVIEHCVTLDTAILLL